MHFVPHWFTMGYMINGAHTTKGAHTMGYNATAYKLDADGAVVSVEAVELDDDGNVIRACGLWSHLNGTAEYEAAWRSSFFSRVTGVRIERDGAEGYRNRLARLALPTSYRGRS